MRLLVATRNRGKYQEIARLLQPAGLGTLGLDDAGLIGDAPELGQTYLENAAFKAVYWSQQYEGPVVADDSGLEVEAMGGKPGVQSARYGGPGLTDAQRNQKLLEEIGAISGASRAALYRCVCALANGGNLLASFSGACQGEIAPAPRGTGGFGYDPIFLFPPLDKTFAEIDPAEKDRVSHRGAAFRSLIEHYKSRGMSP
jgi:XTP/dITP diphosphohydrolase